MTQPPKPLVLFVPVLPNDSSCANLRNAHVNLSNLWLMLAILYLEAGMTRQYVEARKRAVMHALASRTYSEIATLGYFMRHLGNL